MAAAEVEDARAATGTLLRPVFKSILEDVPADAVLRLALDVHRHPGRIYAGSIESQILDRPVVTFFNADRCGKCAGVGVTDNELGTGIGLQDNGASRTAVFAADRNLFAID